MFGGITIIWLIGDTHFSHRRICEYTGRPFDTVEEMDDTLISNWNALVKEEDVVIHLGDFCFGDPVPYLRQLTGKKIFLRGNHDRHIKTIYWLMFDGFLLIHRPKRPYWWDGWIVHAHTHNHTPFINEERKLVNVAVENTEYKPVPYDFLRALF